MSVTRTPKRWHFKLRTILLIVNLVLLLLPLAGIIFFRIYENELVKQTELELISQAAFIAAAYKQEVSYLLESAGDKRPYGIQVSVPWPAGELYRPVGAQLHLSSHNIQPRPPDAIKTEVKAEAIGLEASIRLAPTLFDAQRTALSGIRILDYRGIVVGGRSEIGLSYAHLDEVQHALTGRYSSAIRERVLKQSPPALASISRGTGIRVFAAFPILKEDRLLGVVLLSRTPRTILQHLYDERETVVLVAASLLLLALGLAVFTSYTIARPLHALIEQTKQFGREDQRALEPLESPITEEVAILSESFTEMARSVEHRSEYIRSFATHVSHEFKTPLTAIQGAIELLQEHAEEMSSEQRNRFLRNISQDTTRLKQLVERLLEMARADVLQAAPGATDLVPVVRKLSERYKELGLVISLSAIDDSMKAQIAPEVLETVFSNLFDNSRQNGAVHVEISLRRVNGFWAITVADNGRGISPANANKIFTPFFTTHRETGGTGLGLGIVKSLLKAYGGDIALATVEQGATFVISLPAEAA
jgi:signal transduction histidine kinase